MIQMKNDTIKSYATWEPVVGSTFKIPSGAAFRVVACKPEDQCRHCDFKNCSNLECGADMRYDRQDVIMKRIQLKGLHVNA